MKKVLIILDEPTTQINMLLNIDDLRLEMAEKSLKN